MKGIGFALLFAVPALGGTVVAPPGGPPPFRVERVPLNESMLRQLGLDLMTVSSSLPAEQPAASRALTLVVALAQELVPDEVAEAVKGFEAGGPLMPASDEGRAAALERVDEVRDWLSREGAGRDGKTLAKAIDEVMAAVADPQAALQAAVDRGAEWHMWVPPLSAYLPALDPPAPDPSGRRISEIEPELPLRAAEEVALASPPVVPFLDEVTTRVLVRFDQPVFDTPREGFVDLQVRSIKADEAGAVAEDGGLWLSPRGPAEVQLAKEAGQLRPWLEARRPLPPGFRAMLSLGGSGAPVDSGRALSKGSTASGGVAVALDAIFSGREVHPRVRILARMTPDGTLQSPPRLWQALIELAEEDPEVELRVLMAKDAFPLLTSFLTLDRGELFLRHHFYALETGGELCDFASLRGSETLGEVESAMAAIREAQGTRTLRGFVNFESTQQRLRAVLDRLPQSASAGILMHLAMFGAPSHLPPEVVAGEVRRALDGVVAVAGGDWMTLDLVVAKQASEEARDVLEAAGRRAALGPDERVLLKEAADVVQDFQLLQGAIRRGRDRMAVAMDPTVDLSLELEEWRAEFNRFLRRLDAAAAGSAVDRVR